MRLSPVMIWMQLHRRISGLRGGFDRATKLPTEFVEEMAKHRSKALISWTEARRRTISQFSVMTSK